MKTFFSTGFGCVLLAASVMGFASPPASDSPPASQQTAASETEFTPPSGYQKRLRAGQEMYCRQIEPAGSRIKRTECFTRLQLEAIDQAQRAYREDMQNQALICADKSCSGG